MLLLPTSPPSARNGIVGRPGNSASATSTPLASPSGSAFPNSCLLNSRPRRFSDPARVTIRPPADRDHQRGNHGHQTVTDRQHSVGFERATEIHAVLQHADQEAGKDLMPVIRMLATASRCVNRDAPSMAP